MYTVSIGFFLYVFGYLLRTQRRREQKKKLRHQKKRAGNDKSQEPQPRPPLAKSVSVAIENEMASEAFRHQWPFQRRASREAAMIAWSPLNHSASASTSSITVEESAVSYAMDGSNVIAPKCKKMKVSGNEHSHGSFFLRAGAVGSFALYYHFSPLMAPITFLSRC